MGLTDILKRNPYRRYAGKDVQLLLDARARWEAKGDRTSDSLRAFGRLAAEQPYTDHLVFERLAYGTQFLYGRVDSLEATPGSGHFFGTEGRDVLVRNDYVVLIHERDE